VVVRDDTVDGVDGVDGVDCLFMCTKFCSSSIKAFRAPLTLLTVDGDLETTNVSSTLLLSAQPIVLALSSSFLIKLIIMNTKMHVRWAR
jgi:hypothetical protein